MGATLIRNHKVFKIDQGKTDDCSLSGIEIVIVASERCSKNCDPHIYKAGIEFIGTIDLFENSYLPKTSYFYNDGLSQSSTLKDGSAFTKHIKKLHDKAETLTVNDLHSMGYYGYSWPVEQVINIDDRSNLKTFSYWLGTRCGAPITSGDDVLRMVCEAGQILCSEKESNIWMSCLWSLDLEQAAKLQQAENGSHFQVF
ncbi:MAG: hypothetical protein EOO52_13235 [Gammaproteobacteria bacterium]|nr:MAG: hypothetical protein EOO52_13235 [Gammaproteobacteria bacterium]